MAPNRRSFLKTTAALMAAWPLARLPGAAARGPAAARGLLFDREDLPRIRANLALPRLAELRTLLRNVDFAAEMKFVRDGVRLNNHVEDFARLRKLVEDGAFAHVVWEDNRHLDLALAAMRRLCDFKRWDYFLEGGRDTIGLQRAPEATIACCYALDWLGDKVPADLRAAVEDKIVNEGAPACYRTLYGLKYPDRVRGWTMDPEDDYPFRFDLSRWPLILNATNLKIIPTCGLGLAAVWFHGRHPEAGAWLELARQSAQAFAIMYGSDGAYDEGVSYWGYTTVHLAMLADAVHRRLGVDDRQLINYPGTIRYALAMSMPCGGQAIEDPNLKTAYNATPKASYVPDLDIVNFGDAAAGIDATAAAWVGHVAGDPLSRHAARHVGTLKMLQAAAWYRPDDATQAPDATLLDVRLSNDWVISRTGWNAADGVVAFRSGGPANHEHADRNSVIFKAHGERLFHDPFKAAYSPTLPRWLLRQTEAHTAVLIDGRGHQYHDGREGTNASWARARVTDFRTGAGWMTVTSDATEAYALALPETVRVTRTLVYLKPDVLVLLDRVQLKAAAPVQVRFQVFNEDRRGEVHASGDSFAIRRPLAWLRAQVAAAGNFAVQTGRLALPVEEGEFPYAEIVSAKAAEHVIVTAALASPAAHEPGRLAIVREGKAWRITGAHAGRRIDISVEPTAVVTVL